MTDKAYIKELIERDKPKPMGIYYWKSEMFKNDPPVDQCGVCNRIIAEDFVFCPICGNRIDKDNYKIGARRQNND